MLNKKNFFPLTYSTWDNQEVKAINRIVNSGQLTYSNQVKKFEAKFAHHMRMKYGIMVNSGSSANLLSIASLFYKKKNPLKRGDEVIVPAISWSTTYHPLQQFNLKLKIVDVQLDTVNIDTKKLIAAITPKTRLIIAVNILGNPCDLFEIRKICKQKGIYLMEDNCESMGAKIKNKFCGTFGIMNTYSFFYSHHISTIEGGMILTNDMEIKEILISLRSHGWTRDAVNKKLLTKHHKKFENYQFVLPGYNLRPTEINAAVGLIQLKKLNNFIKIRRDNFNLYQKIFRNNKIFTIQKENGKSSAFSFIFIFKKEYLNIKDKIFKKLKKYNIQYRLITGGCFTKHEVKKYFNYSVYKNLNNANYIHENGFFLGNAAVDLKDQLINFNKAIIEFY
jgi:CDP-6-deoxy-D-xylo-4-hexulose-3-dehydrase